MTDNLWRCKECEWTGRADEIEMFPDPKMEGNYWEICPQCREAESCEQLCEKCSSPATCGTPTPDGYRRTCYEHRL